MILSGDVPLISAQAISDLVNAHEQRDAAATMATMELDEPGQYGRVVRDRARQRREGRRGQGRGRRDARAARDPRGQHRDLRVRRRQPARGARPDRQRQRAGRAVPAGRAPEADRVREDGPGARRHGSDAHAGHQRPRRPGERPKLAQHQIHDRHARNGVTIIDPASTLIDADVTIGQDTTIEPGTSLKGATTIGEDCAIGPHTTIIDSTLGDGVSVPHSYLVQAQVDDFGTIGPVRLPAPRRPSAPQGQGRRVRRDQELEHRRGHEGPAPELHRRRRHRAEHEHRRLQHHRQLRRPQQAPDDDRRERQDERRHRVRRARQRSAMARTPERVASSPRTSRRTRSASPAPARKTSRTMRSGGSRDDRRASYTPPRRDCLVASHVIGHLAAAQRL